MTAPLCFIDTETTGLHPGRRAWEVAIIRREPNATERTLHVFVEDVDLSEADLYGLKVGRFHDRHPAYNGNIASTLDTDPFDPWAAQGPMPPGALLCDESRVAQLVERLTRGAHLVGAVPNFDAEVLADMLRRNWRTPAWHYHLIDVETLAVGSLAAQGFSIPMPWSSDALSDLLAVVPASDEDRHTALGDARWAMRIYDAVMSTTARPVAASVARVEGPG